MSTIFSKIINNEIPSYKVYEDEKFIAFLDINPVAKGHTLVVPKKEVDKYYDLDEFEYKEMMVVVYKLSKVIEKSIPCKRVGLMVIGLEVPHAHVHLVPINSEAEMNLRNKMNLSEEEFVSIAEKIKSNL